MTQPNVARRFLGVSRAAVLVAMLAACSTGGRAAPPHPTPESGSPTTVPAQPAPLRFSAERAYALTRDISRRFPFREAATPAFRAAATFVAARFAESGYR